FMMGLPQPANRSQCENFCKTIAYNPGTGNYVSVADTEAITHSSPLLPTSVCMWNPNGGCWASVERAFILDMTPISTLPDPMVTDWLGTSAKIMSLGYYTDPSTRACQQQRTSGSSIAWTSTTGTHVYNHSVSCDTYMNMPVPVSGSCGAANG